MNPLPLISLGLVAAIAPHAAAQFVPVSQERHLQTAATVLSGPSDSDSADAPDFAPMNTSIGSNIPGTVYADAMQNSSFASALINGDLFSSGGVAAVSPLGDRVASSTSSLLFAFDLAEPTWVTFLAEGEKSPEYSNMFGDPPAINGTARVSLINTDTLDQIAGFHLVAHLDTHGYAFFRGTLPAGSYAIQALSHTEITNVGFDFGLARAGDSDASLNFSLSVVPAPGASALLGLGTLAFSRRRRAR